MTHYFVVLNSDADRMKALKIVSAAPAGTRLEVKAAKRTIPQNEKMWAMLTDVSRQLLWHEQRLRPDDWKLVFMDALRREVRIVPNIEGDGFVNLGRSSSNLTKAEMADLIELIHAFGAKHGVKFQDEVAA